MSIPHHTHNRRLRSLLAGLLIAGAVLLGPLCVLGAGTSTEINATDDFVSRTAPLAANPQVQTDLTTQITATVMKQLTGSTLTLVPPGLAKSLVETSVRATLTSSAFTAAWTQATRAAHRTAANLLADPRSGAIRTQGQQVSIDLAPAIRTVEHQLAADGLVPAAKLPDFHVSFVLISSPAIPRAQNAYRALHLAGSLWPAGVAAIVLGIGLSRNRPRALLASGLALGANTLALAALLAVGRDLFVYGLPAAVPTPVGGVCYDAAVHFIRYDLWAVVAVSTLTALSGWGLIKHSTLRIRRTLPRSGLAI
ncbi:hypothetical protein [Streptomyces mirabilis]|uniref:hypothetical protein n=1 Tax=Streptomyces mirabilis TaxID=68239 RepID=UPI003691AB1D